MLRIIIKKKTVNKNKNIFIKRVKDVGMPKIRENRYVISMQQDMYRGMLACNNHNPLHLLFYHRYIFWPFNESVFTLVQLL